MKIDRLVVGPLEENCYILSKRKSAIIIDPGDEEKRIDDFLLKNKLILKAILITHAHFDHIGALDYLIDKYNVNVYYYNINNELNTNIHNIFEEKIEIDEFKFETIYTPGHRNDLITFYFYEENVMFTGDFLFKGTVGRTDFKYSNYNDMIKSINKIKKYDDNITVYPGHGEKTKLKNEKQSNFFFIN